MEIVGEFARRQGIAPTQPFTSRVPGSVNGAMHFVRFLSDVFHDVDLAAARPVDGADVVAEHPEGRPHSLSPGNLDSGLEASILLLK